MPLQMTKSRRLIEGAETLKFPFIKITEASSSLGVSLKYLLDNKSNAANGIATDQKAASQYREVLESLNEEIEEAKNMAEYEWVSNESDHLRNSKMRAIKS